MDTVPMAPRPLHPRATLTMKVLAADRQD